MVPAADLLKLKYPGGRKVSCSPGPQMLSCIDAITSAAGTAGSEYHRAKGGVSLLTFRPREQP